MPEFDFQKAFERVHDRIGEVHQDVSDKIDEVSKELTETRTKLSFLIGNGQPGEIQHMKDDIGELKDFRSSAKGYIAAISAVGAALGMVGHFLIDIFKKH